MSRRIRVGVAGVGHMGKEHARIYAELAEADLVGVHDSDPETSRKIAAKCKTRAFASLDEMVEEAGLEKDGQRHGTHRCVEVRWVCVLGICVGGCVGVQTAVGGRRREG